MDIGYLESLVLSLWVWGFGHHGVSKLGPSLLAVMLTFEVSTGSIMSSHQD